MEQSSEFKSEARERLEASVGKSMADMDEGVSYRVDGHGVIHQVGGEKMEYDRAYVEAIYNSSGQEKINGYGQACLRMGYIARILGGLKGVRTVLDVGYGNGDFLKACADFGLVSFGCDVSGYDMKDERVFLTTEDTENTEGGPWRRKAFDLVTFFDSLEHFESLDFVSELKANFVVVSLPWCPSNEAAAQAVNGTDGGWEGWRDCELFAGWKHRKPGEHLHHFNDRSLRSFMATSGFSCLAISNMEDAGRKCPQARAQGRPNILTGVFYRRSPMGRKCWEEEIHFG
jgi:SAM-dependent methyltransferase